MTCIFLSRESGDLVSLAGSADFALEFMNLMSRIKQEKSTGRAPVAEESPLHRAQRLIRQSNYNAALEVAFHPGPDVQLRNAKGVCLLRLGQAHAAVVLYREIVFKPGCSWVRPELPTPYKVNFATALLLNGNISGCVGVLNEALDPTHPGIQRLRACIRRWERGLTFWQRLNWMCGWTDESNSHVPLDFEPGLLEDGAIAELPSATPTATLTPAA